MQKSSIITQCPSCETQFRVTPGQLKVANGQVRCGACLAIFCAVEYEQKPQSAEPTTQQKAKTRRVHEDETPDTFEKLDIELPISKEKTSPKPDKAVTNTSSATNLTKKDQEEIVKTVSAADVPTLTIEAEPVVLNRSNGAKASSPWWFIGCVLAILTLVAQHLWFNRGDLYWTHTYRPLYDTVCQHIDCQIPTRVNTAKITNQQFLIRPHSEIADAITIDIVLINEANHNQPYPALHIAFSDLKGRPVASRTLQPESYLDRSVVNLKSMPTHQPIQISLDLMSPGMRGINYQLELLAPAL
ncbi:zinc-ribbon and DUF3426 domain-containing protein [Neptuniibacter sp. QD48_11]|uniref:zinc-ribbon and DUF3426 domain-containing protein n=1 Tax=unclassified Neptuniibacter TaxID=2630693 RepID=UPI0039F49042